MSAVQLRIAGAGLFFIFVFLSGIWLSSSGRPYAAVIFNIHKFIALGAAVFLAVTVYQVNQQAALGTAAILVCLLTAVLFVATIITGGLLNIETPVTALLLTLHHILPFLTTFSTAAALYMLLIRQ